MQVGTRVSFKFKGSRKEGLVLRERTVRRKGRARALALHVTGNANSLDHDVIEIADPEGPVVYTVGRHGVIEIAEATPESANLARNTEMTIKNQRAGVAAERINTACDNLENVKIGDYIEVKFNSGRWERRKFAGLVPGSGRVRFIGLNGRPRYSHPQHVRAIKNS